MSLTVNNAVYKHLSANYVMSAIPANVTYSIYAKKAGTEIEEEIIKNHSIPYVNFKLNYNTNIVGELMTGSLDYNIELNQETGSEANNSGAN